MPDDAEMAGSEGLARALGRLEGAVDRLGIDAIEGRREARDEAQKSVERDAASKIAMDSHIVADATAFGTIRAALGEINATLTRIRKPVDAYLSVRNFVITLLALGTSGVAIFTGVPHLAVTFPHYVWSLFHSSQ